MGFTENVVFSMSTAKASGLLQVDSKRTSSCRNEEINLCMFTLDADCIVEAQDNNKEALQLHESAQCQKDMSFRENEFSLLCGHALVKARNSTKRAASLDFQLENVLPAYEHIADQLGCKSGCKSFWKNLRFWLRTKKVAAAGSCRSVASRSSASEFKLVGAHRPKVARAKRGILEPPYTDGSSRDSGSRRSKLWDQQHSMVIDDQAVSAKCDGLIICPYMPLNRCSRIPSGPLYLP